MTPMPIVALAKAKKLRRSRAPQVMRGLTTRQARFVVEYLVDLNGTRAAIRAGFSAKGADVTASRLLVDPRVQAQVERGVKRLLGEPASKAERVIREVTAVAHSNVAEFVDADDNLLLLDQLPEQAQRAIASIEVIAKSPRRVKVKLWDKNAGLALLAKYHDLASPERHVHDHRVEITAESVHKMSTSELNAAALALAQELTDSVLPVAGERAALPARTGDDT